MSQTALDTLDTAAQALRRAMEGGDADGINRALVQLASAVETVRGVGAWRADPELKHQLRDMLDRLESDRQLSRLLGDLTAQQLDHFAGTTPAATAPVTYGRKR